MPSLPLLLLLLLCLFLQVVAGYWSMFRFWGRGWLGGGGRHVAQQILAPDLAEVLVLLRKSADRAPSALPPQPIRVFLKSLIHLIHLILLILFHFARAAGLSTSVTELIVPRSER